MARRYVGRQNHSVGRLPYARGSSGSGPTSRSVQVHHRGAYAQAHRALKPRVLQCQLDSIALVDITLVNDVFAEVSPKPSPQPSSLNTQPFTPALNPQPSTRFISPNPETRMAG
jgi:hypothetical protein